MIPNEIFGIRIYDIEVLDILRGSKTVARHELKVCLEISVSIEPPILACDHKIQ